jgi:hypothetical protein
MILFGAGSSVPFGIPAMKPFVAQFKETIAKDVHQKSLLTHIESALENSEKLVGANLEFDLESLMVVLQDLSSGNRPVSLPTFALMLYSLENKYIQEHNTETLRDVFCVEAKELLQRLQLFIFEKCIEPIKAGQKNNSYLFLDLFYGPLFNVLDANIYSNHISWIFTTNWDLCLKQWLEHARISFEDGTKLDGQKKGVLNPSEGWTTTSIAKVVTLHGSFDLVTCNRFPADSIYIEIQKVSRPEIYFSGNPSEISNAFIVYPLEAVGYDQTVRSPYLDMLNHLKTQLREETHIFIVGFSFRDSVIASIFDEVIREKAEQGQEKRMKILLVDAAPQAIIENLKHKGHINLANNITPVEVSFPNVLDYENNRTQYIQDTQTLISKLIQALKKSSIPCNGKQVADFVKRYGVILNVEEVIEV